MADLTTESGVNLLMQWLENEYVIGLFLAPPCGSASRARNIPLKRKSPGDPPAPRPLRSDEHPNGLPFLQFTDRIKVSKANKLYHLTAKLVRWADEVGCIVCIENPQFSFFWQTTFIQSILHLLQFTVFQSCQYGSHRPKRTMLAFNAKEFAVINKMCCGIGPSHKHAKWGIDPGANKFATALETAYPMMLAKMIATQFLMAFYRLGFKVLPETMSELTSLDSEFLPALRAEGGIQSKASRLPPMIPTYAAKVLLTGFVQDLPDAELMSKLPADLPVGTINAPTQLLKGSKLLALKPPLLPAKSLQGGPIVSSQQVKQEDVDKMIERFSSTTDNRVGECQSQLWGVPWSEEQFVQQMVKYGHPTSLQSCLPEVLKRTVEIYSTTSSHERISHRASRLGYWLRRLYDLRSDEAALKDKMHPDVSAILGSKNILVWQEMLESSGYGDMDVVGELRDGTELVGQIPKTGLWPMKFTPAVLSEADLAEVAAKERPTVVESFEGLSNNDFTEEVWNKTLEEQRSGLLEGPLEISDVPVSCPLSRRFGIQQGSKVRCIDDFSMSSVNSCVQGSESPKPHTLDVFAAMCAIAMKVVPSTSSWKGRTFDLTGAYRQCAVHPKSAKYAYIMVLEPSTGKLKAFRMKALPFGAVRSVHAFLRISHSIWHLLVSEFWVLSTNYFDDFVTLSMRDEADAVTACVHMFFKLIGWLFAESGDKAPCFAEEFNALGVSINVRAMHAGTMSLGNTESRRREIALLITEVLGTGRMTRVTALRLRGRLQFASANIFGRVPKAALAMVTNHAHHAKSDEIDADTQLALGLHLRMLLQGRPREVKAAEQDCWFIQTDASFEPSESCGTSGIGAVLFDPSGRPVAFFSSEVSPEVLCAMNPGGIKKTIIFECEFLALYAAFDKWNAKVAGSLVIYTDNNAVRDAMISCSTKNKVAKSILIAALTLESDRSLWPWYSRVPTQSNTADNPSRFEIQKLLQMGAIQEQLDTVDCWRSVEAIIRQWGDEQASAISQLTKGASD